MEIHTSFDLVLSSTVSHNPMKILLKNQVYCVKNDHILVVKDLFRSEFSAEIPTEVHISSRMYKFKMTYFSN